MEWGEQAGRVRSEISPTTGATGPLEQSLRAALVESRSRYKDLVELSSDFAFETDSAGRFVFVSPKGALGYSAGELVGRMAADLIFDPSGTTDESHAFAPRHGVVDGEAWVRMKSGAVALLLVTAAPIGGPADAFAGARGMARDVTQTHAQAQALARADLRERLLLRILRAAETDIDPAKAIEAVAAEISPATGSACRIFARSGPVGLIASAGPGPTFESVELYAVETLTAREIDGGYALLIPARYGARNVGTLVLWRPLSERAFAPDECDLGAALAGHIGLLLAQVDAQHALARLARTDPLTGLFNRRAFTDEVERRLVRIRAGQGHGALVLIDLDNFKPINDRLGHAAGDEVLIAVAGHLTAAVRGPDLVARLGGDEFAVWFEGVDAAVAKARATAIAKAAVTLAPAAAAIGVPLGLSVGVAVMDSHDGVTLADLTRRADGALYAAKAAGKGRVEMAL